uniref:Uncharacterized protein n=1 Tax=Rhizophora mucronata TaxID=61149 RepID=A0A2P2QW24_RHIMU
MGNSVRNIYLNVH